MNDNLPIIKVYNIDFSFILKNYLNPEMWTKKWTLFQYKEFVFTLNIARIDCEDEKIVFNIALEDILNVKKYYSEWNAYPNRVLLSVYYSLKIDNLKFLKKKIYSQMVEAIRVLEQRRCQALEEYKEIEDGKYAEESLLREIAEIFLDDNHVYNSDIREAYIEKYLDNNCKIDNRLNDFIISKKYKLLTDLYLIVAESQQDEELIRIILAEDEEYENIYEEVKEYMVQLETQEYKDELAKNLEDI